MRKLIALVVSVLLIAACSGAANEPAKDPIPVKDSELRSGAHFDAVVPCSLQGVFDKPDKVWLCTLLNGSEGLETLGSEALQTTDTLHGWYVYDETEIGLDEAHGLLESFREAVEYGTHAGVACFMPHHALRIEKEGRALEILVCLLCKNCYVFPEGGRNNVALDMRHGFEAALRGVVAAHGLRDYTIEHPDKKR